jgi:oligogalacturonide lyase
MPFDARITRRALLAAVSGAMGAARAQTGSTIPPEFRRYADAATETPVTRLTDPAHTSFLPAPHLAAVNRHGSLLLYANDRSGQMQLYRMDLKSGASHQLTAAEPVLPGAATLLPGERNIAYMAGHALIVRPFRPGPERAVYRAPDGFEFTGGFSVSGDGAFAAVVEKSEPEKSSATWRLQRVSLLHGDATTLADSHDEIRDPMARPGTSEILFREGDRLRLQNRTLMPASGPVGPCLWSPDGASVLYLDANGTIRELNVTTGADVLVSRTSRFASFGRNADASVFVGASASKASPAVLLLLRSVRREFTLCEHRASDPALVAPRFSPNSQTVLFQSDKNGKMALYAVNVERLVEKTET